MDEQQAVYETQSQETDNSNVILDLFLRTSHHNNISMMFLTQNIFFKNKHFRSISLNATHIIIFPSLRDTTQIKVLAMQMGVSKKLSELASKLLKTEKHPYIVLDFTLKTPELFRIRSHILPTDTVLKVYK